MSAHFDSQVLGLWLFWVVEKLLLTCLSDSSVGVICAARTRLLHLLLREAAGRGGKQVQEHGRGREGSVLGELSENEVMESSLRVQAAAGHRTFR